MDSVPTDLPVHLQQRVTGKRRGTGGGSAPHGRWGARAGSPQPSPPAASPLPPRLPPRRTPGQGWVSGAVASLFPHLPLPPCFFPGELVIPAPMCPAPACRAGGIRREVSAVAGLTGKPAACGCRLLGSGTAQRPSSSSSSPSPTLGFAGQPPAAGLHVPSSTWGWVGEPGDGKPSACRRLCHGASSGRGGILLCWGGVEDGATSHFPLLLHLPLPFAPQG